MKKGIEKIFASRYWWLLVLIALFVINYFASAFHTRFDLTKEKRYTLSKATKNLLAKLDDNVQIDVFLKGEFPAGFRKLANTTKEFLDLLKEKNSSKIQYRFISPLDAMEDGKTTYADKLIRMKAKSINLTVRRKAGESSNLIFPVAIITYKNRQSVVTLLPGAGRDLSQDNINISEALMEYQFLKEFDKLTQTQKAGIAYATGNGEPLDDGSVYQLRKSLEEKYNFGILDLKKQPKIPEAVDLLILVKPSEQFSEEQKLKIDQYVMNGGKLLCFIDNLYAEMDSFAFKPETIAYDRNLNLTDLFFKYGLRINTDLVMDLRCDVNYITVGGTPQEPQNEFLPWNYFPFVTTPSGNNKFVVPGYIGLKFANSIDTINADNVRKTPLLVTSQNSRLIGTPALISLNENKIKPVDQDYNRKSITVGMLLEGNFTSLYKNRVSMSQKAWFDSTGTAFKPLSEESKIIVVADGDLVFNDYIPKTNESGEIIQNEPPEALEMGWNKYTYWNYLQGNELGKYFIPVANKDFFLNCVEYLVNDPAISEVRSKEIRLRLLDPQKIDKQKTTWQFINIALPILLIIFFGFIYQQIRKRKYAA